MDEKKTISFSLGPDAILGNDDLLFFFGSNLVIDEGMIVMRSWGNRQEFLDLQKARWGKIPGQGEVHFARRPFMESRGEILPFISFLIGMLLAQGLSIRFPQLAPGAQNGMWVVFGISIFLDLLLEGFVTKVEFFRDSSSPWLIRRQGLLGSRFSCGRPAIR